MKLTIGENIRRFRKKNDLTQEALADRLGVTYQSVSRWEKGTTYPDLELLPAIASLLAVTVDELLGVPSIEKEKRAAEAFDELRRECVKRDYDAEKIVELLCDIRRNYLDSDKAWRPWCEGNSRAFRDPKILPEVRLLAQAFLERHPMNAHVLKTMAEIEDEEHLQPFLDRYAASFDCSQRALLFDRYLVLGDAQRFEPERRYKLYKSILAFLDTRNLLKMGASREEREMAELFRTRMLSLVRSDAVDERPDMWVDERIEFGFWESALLAGKGKKEEAISNLEKVVGLLEDTMKITDKVLLPTSCRFLEGMEVYAEERWSDRDNHPDSPDERFIFVVTHIGNMCTCSCIYSADYYDRLQGEAFKALKNDLKFEELCLRIKALILTRAKQA